MTKLVVGINDLATVNPELAKEWNYEKNDGLTPQMFMGISGKKVWWKCEKGHEWESKVSDRSRGNGCPYCSNKKVLKGFNDLETVNPILCKEWNYAKNDTKPFEYTFCSGKKVWWKCEKGHEWQASIAHRKNGRGCPYCKNRKIEIGTNDLATTQPILVQEWNYERNSIRPTEVTAGSERSVWWKCSLGHEYKASIYHRVSGTNCPYCNNHKLLEGFNDLKTTNLDLACEWDYKKNVERPEKVFAGSHKKVWWVGKCGHNWKASIASRNNGNGCPFCANQEVLVGFNDLATLYPDLVSEWNYNKNGKIMPKDIIASSNKKVWWQCKEQHEWQAIISNRIKGIGCPYCSGRLAIQGQTDLATKKPSLIKYWNYTKNAPLLPTQVTLRSTKNVWWLCDNNHEYRAKIVNKSKNTKNSMCPYCSNRLVLAGFNDLATVSPQLVIEWNYEKNQPLLPTTVVGGGHKKVWWRCSKGHEWQAVIKNRIKGIGCPYCNGSKTERLTYNILKELKIPFRAEKKFEQDIQVKYYPYDVWISKYGLLIELDGLQHFTDKIKYFEDNTPFQERRRRDNVKNDFCLKHTLLILRIPYTYNPDTEKEKIKQLIVDFINTRKVPQEIIDFYDQYKENNNYAEIARKLNAL